MAFGGARQGAARAESSWQDYLNKLRQQQQMDKSGMQAVAGARDASTGQQISALSSSPVGYGAQAVQQAGSTAGGNATQGGTTTKGGTGSISDDTYVRPGMWYSSFPMTGIAKLSQDPARAVDLWATKTGKGRAYGRMLNSMIDPVSALRIMGYDAGDLSKTNTKPLDAFASLWDKMSGAQKGPGGNNLYFNPTGMLSNVLNASYDPKSTEAMSLGQAVGNPNLLPEEQVQNTIGLIMSGLQGFVSDSALSAYAAMLNEAAMDFLNSRDANPESFDSKTTFNKYLAQRYGSGGGLF